MALSRLKHMYSVLLTFTLRPMSSDARPGLCSRDSARAGVFARSAMSSTYSVSLIFSVEYCLLFGFFSVKPFSLVISIDVRST